MAALDRTQTRRMEITRPRMLALPSVPFENESVRGLRGRTGPGPRLEP